MIREVVTTLKQLDKLTETLIKGKKFSFDVETTKESYPEIMETGVGIKPSSDALRFDRLAITGISFCNGEVTWYIPIKPKHRDKIINKLKDLFAGCSNFKLIAHNFVFDALVLFKYGIDLRQHEWFDTMVAHHLIDENSEHGLKYLTRTVLGKEVTEFQDVGWNHYQPQFYEYGLDDAVNTWELHLLFKEQLLDGGLNKLFVKTEMPFLKGLLEMETTGVKVNVNKVEGMKVTLSEEISDLHVKLYQELKEPYEVQYSIDGKNYTVSGGYNFNSSKQLAKILFEKLGLEPTGYTPAGAPQTGREVLARYKDNKFVAILNKYKACQKLLSGFVEPLPLLTDSDGRVRPHFSDIGARTGRLSCSRPNLQQLPNGNKLVPIDFRSVFTATPGYKMIMADYSGQEVAIIAQVSNDPTLIDALNKGKDLHLTVANQFYNLGIPEEKLFKAHKEFDELKERFEKERKAAKTITFGLAYGKGAYGLSKDFNITEDEAQEMIDKYFAGMPSVKTVIDETHRDVNQRGFVRSMTGRYRHFQKNEQGYYPGGAYRQSFNFLIQSAGADMIRMATNRVVNMRKEHPEWDLRLLMTVHDEVVFEAKEQYAKRASLAIKKAFESVAKFKVPVVADVQLGNNYSEAK